MRDLSTVAFRCVIALAGCISFLTVSLTACKRPAAAHIDTTATSATTEAPAIRLALHAYIDQTAGAGPVDLEMAQVGVDSGYALVTWAHEKVAGQAVLRKQAGAWEVLECSDGWLGLRGICKEQVPTEVAKRLLDQVDPRWSSYETP
ncbi:MAG: hypothetical protein ABI689_15290 [Thermoanaerobaculia bacterium]